MSSTSIAAVQIGPLRLADQGDEWVILTSTGQALMGNREYENWTPRDRAVWQLFAAAPDLLAALVAVIDAGLPVGPGYVPIEAAGRAAIAKATGGKP